MKGGATGHDGRASAEFEAWQRFTLLAYKLPRSNQPCQFLILMSIIKAHLIIPERIARRVPPPLTAKGWVEKITLGKENSVKQTPCLTADDISGARACAPSLVLSSLGP